MRFHRYMPCFEVCHKGIPYLELLSSVLPLLPLTSPQGSGAESRFPRAREAMESVRTSQFLGFFQTLPCSPSLLLLSAQASCGCGNAGGNMTARIKRHYQVGAASSELQLVTGLPANSG